MAKAYDRDEGGAAGCAKMGYVGLPPESRRSSYFARQSAWGRVLTFANNAIRPAAALRPRLLSDVALPILLWHDTSNFRCGYLTLNGAVVTA